MVYCGPPSKGCSSCRARKIRRASGCGQCEKRQQTCPGYRNPVDLMFRDESSHVIQKIRARQTQRKRRPGPSSNAKALSTSGSVPGPASPVSASASPSTPASRLSPLSAPTTIHPSTRPSTPNPRTAEKASSHPEHPTIIIPETVVAAPDIQQDQEPSSPRRTHEHDNNLLPSPDRGWPSTPAIARMYTLAPTLQERGIAFFFSRYVTVADNTVQHRFDFVYDIWKPAYPNVQTATIDTVLASITAVGLVGVAHLTHTAAALDDARKSYGTALCLINEALSNRDTAVRDTTMLAVLILGIYEMMAPPGPRTMHAWHEHLRGAIVLAQLRGTDQLRTRAGRRMFHMLCASAWIASFQRQKPLSPTLLALMQESRNAALQETPDDMVVAATTNVVFPAACSLLHIRHRLQDDLLKAMPLDALLAELDAVDAALAGAAAALPTAWRYRVQRVTRPHAAVFGDTCHVYPSVAVAAAWNSLRTGRVLVQETVLAAIQQQFAQFADVGDDRLPAPYRQVYRDACVVLERLAGAIVASIPQHFGLVDDRRDSALPIAFILTTEIRTPSMESVAAGDNTADAGDATAEDDAKVVVGPSLLRPTCARNDTEAAERQMLLASAPNAAIWPLFCVGMGAICRAPLQAYVVDRLSALYDETGSSQARAIAAIMRRHRRVPSPWQELQDQALQAAQETGGSETAMDWI